MSKFLNSIFRRSAVTRLGTALGIGAALTLGGCAADEPVPEPEPVSTEITVTGTGNEAPHVEFETPYPSVPAQTEVLWDAHGDRVEDGLPVLLRIYAVDGASGKVERNDFESVPGIYRMDPNEIGGQMYEALKDVSIGSRIKLVSPHNDSSLITIIDVFAAYATGTVNDGEPESPNVSFGDDQEPLIEIPQDLAAPTTLRVQQLKTGRGVQVAEGDLVVLQFVGVTWSTGEVFDTTWGPDNLPVAVTVGQDQLIQGLEETLIGVPIGSQLMVVIPPELGFGPSNNDLTEETLVYVIDLLAASSSVPEGTGD